ncbi:MAG TPA: hypothetical protein VHE30_23745 [Polyangiaceae bacterium]|nr:hypothetical protein [Polyangiaceae bacterium]
MASADETLTLLRLQRELLALSPESRKTLLMAFLEGSPVDAVVAQRARPRRSEERQPKKRRAQRARSGRKGVQDSVAALSIRAVFASPIALWASDVLGEVKKFKPDVKPVNVYAALHSAAEDGKLFKEMVGNKARYSRPKGPAM